MNGLSWWSGKEDQDREWAVTNKLSAEKTQTCRCELSVYPTQGTEGGRLWSGKGSGTWVCLYVSWVLHNRAWGSAGIPLVFVCWGRTWDRDEARGGGTIVVRKAGKARRLFNPKDKILEGAQRGEETREGSIRRHDVDKEIYTPPSKTTAECTRPQPTTPDLPFEANEIPTKPSQTAGVPLFLVSSPGKKEDTALRSQPSGVRTTRHLDRSLSREIPAFVRGGRGGTHPGC